jgi:hypothetical protein
MAWQVSIPGFGEPVQRISPAPRWKCKSLLRARVSGKTGRLP